ncbi:hypothetical protein X801_05139 [Opisthorchis viverrini]|uniref:Uncharacterized protein n=2 Tax=Opisthorchis viverrini TaxID=6198 RepID=A0A1S8WWU9_OPIVI|nr:hypothetical protein T265_06286 [Opisthorchis viverrini]KER26499.1 hypothetical protein T265_06286 [Opisthorchis viverrini]OON18999.1 hypothetical protein X801_05139 [Opisthorchis viverrini]
MALQSRLQVISGFAYIIPSAQYVYHLIMTPYGLCIVDCSGMARTLSALNERSSVEGGKLGVQFTGRPKTTLDGNVVDPLYLHSNVSGAPFHLRLYH